MAILRRYFVMLEKHQVFIELYVQRNQVIDQSGKVIFRKKGQKEMSKLRLHGYVFINCFTKH